MFSIHCSFTQSLFKTRNAGVSFIHLQGYLLFIGRRRMKRVSDVNNDVMKIMIMMESGRNKRAEEVVQELGCSHCGLSSRA